jgi:hypothetical protein
MTPTPNGCATRAALCSRSTLSHTAQTRTRHGIGQLSIVAGRATQPLRTPDKGRTVSIHDLSSVNNHRTCPRGLTGATTYVAGCN